MNKLKKPRSESHRKADSIYNRNLKERNVLGVYLRLHTDVIDLLDLLVNIEKIKNPTESRKSIITGWIKEKAGNSGLLNSQQINNSVLPAGNTDSEGLDIPQSHLADLRK